MSHRRGQEGALPACYAMVFPGLETIATEEIQSRVGGDVKKSAPGILVFRVAELDASLLSLRTIEDVFLLGWGTDQLTYRAADLDKIRHWTERDADWNRLLQIHHAIRPKPKGKTTYHFVTQMVGHHGYRRMDARKALLAGLAGKLPASWRYVEEDASVEIWLTIHDAMAVCGLRLSDRTQRHRSYKLEHRPASLRPSIAAALAWLSGLRPGLVILDPMCGVGTILAETLELARSQRIQPLTVLGGDIEVAAVTATAANLRKLGEVKVAPWDATALPLPDASVDRIICNPPFGKQMASPEEIGPLYQRLLRDWNRVLRPGGLAVLLVSDARALSEATSRVKWKRTAQHRVRVLGQLASISLWRKPGS